MLAIRIARKDRTRYIYFSVYCNIILAPMTNSKDLTQIEIKNCILNYLATDKYAQQFQSMVGIHNSLRQGDILIIPYEEFRDIISEFNDSDYLETTIWEGGRTAYKLKYTGRNFYKEGGYKEENIIIKGLSKAKKIIIAITLGIIGVVTFIVSMLTDNQKQSIWDWLFRQYEYIILMFK
jgi:hypothetical protein